MRDRSSLSVGDIKSVIQNFVDKMKEQLLEGKSVNIEGLGVFMLAARSKGADLAKDITAKSVESVRIFFQANKELRITKSATREDEKLDLISLDEYLKKNSVVVSPEDPENPGEGGGEGYTEFVTELANYITESGRTPMFWSDVISQEPEVYHLLPKNLICLHWDYASNVSSERLTRLANSGAEHLYVCPGVQGWNQLINKYHEAYENISRMARYGHECHAMGLLNTDWGDYGHINHPDFSRIGMIYGAAFSWNADILPEEEINRQISVLEFGDASGKLVSVLDLLCHQDAYPWRTAVMVQEALELHQDKEEAAELLRSCAEGDADAANASIDALCAVLYEKAGTVRPENRPMIYAYLLAADGLKVLNRLLPFLRASLLSEGTLPEKEDCFALAGDLERWLHSYKELWRTVSKESELYRIAHVFCWYADLLRDLNA